MEKRLWKKIAALFADMDRGILAFKQAGDVDGQAVIENPDTNILQVRDTVRKKLDQLRVDLSEFLTDQESYYVLFAIVIYIDEDIQINVLDKAQMSWPLLQKELFDIDDGGNLFYDTLDHILRKPEVSLFVFEVYYFCLKHGFQGRYITDPVKIADYKKSLEQKLGTHDMENEVLIPEERPDLPHLFSPAWYYGIALVFLVFAYAGFSLF